MRTAIVILVAIAAAIFAVGSGIAHAADTQVPWPNAPHVDCNRWWIDPPATFNVTMVWTVDGKPGSEPASWGSHHDPFIDPPAVVFVRGPHDVDVHATATISNQPGKVAVSETTHVTLTCVPTPTTTTTMPSTTTMVPTSTTTTSVQISTPATASAPAPVATQPAFTG